MVKAYVKHFSRKGDTVLDPFCGSGVTAIEALTEKRRSINVDIAPLSIFITRQTCVAPVDLKNLQKTFTGVELRMKETVEFVREAKKKEIESYRIKEWYPKKVPLPSNADCECVEDLFEKKQLIVLAKLLKEIKAVRNKEARDLLLFAFSGILHRASKTYSIDAGKAGGGDSGIFKVYRYWIPPHPDTRDVWDLFRTRFSIIKRAKTISNQAINDHFEEGKTFFGHVGSATKLTDFVAENSVDYIYTDPPYGAHIAYLDLTTMWDAWLGFKVKEEHRKLEVIEGGDQRHTKEEYLDLFQRSFEQMYKVLKRNAWVSLVFHHKEVRLWYSIKEIAKEVGLEYINTVAQPISKWTFHKVRNPLKVLGEQLIVNFRKSKQLFKGVETPPLSAMNVIYNAAEREIVRTGGATLEEIMRAVVPELFEANLVDKIALRTTSDVGDLLGKEFELGPDDRWHLKTEKEKTVGQFLPSRDRLRYYLISFLRREKKSDFDKLVTGIFPLLLNGDKPSREEILEVLEEIGVSRNGRTWELKSPDKIAIQNELDFRDEIVPGVELPEGSTHDQMIYRLIVLGNKAGFIPYLGKRERIIGGKDIFRDLRYLKEFPLPNLRTDVKTKIEQIDCIWFYGNKTPVFAFEVEEKTGILSALERFHALLKLEARVGIDKRLVIVTPLSRKRKLTQELTSSSYIGHPTYMENKVVYIFYDMLLKYYPILLRRESLKAEDIDRLCTPATIISKQNKLN